MNTSSQNRPRIAPAPPPAVIGQVTAALEANLRDFSEAYPVAPDPALSKSTEVSRDLYTQEVAKKKLVAQHVLYTEIALFMLSNKDLALSEVANRFRVTPATVGRIVSTDGFQKILETEAKTLAIKYASSRSVLEGKIEAGASIAVDRLLDRIQVTNDTTTLLQIVKTLGELIGMGSKGGSAVNVQVNSYGVTGDHLRMASSFQKPALVGAAG